MRIYRYLASKRQQLSGCRASTDSGGADPDHVLRHVTHLNGSFNIYGTITSQLASPLSLLFNSSNIFEYTTVQPPYPTLDPVIPTVSFLAPGYALNFLVDVDNKKALIKDGGDILFNATTMPHIEQAVIGILTHLEETANRPVKISSVETTQNEILDIAKKIDPAAEWDIKHCRTEDLKKTALGRWAQGDHSEEVVEMFINRAFLGKGWGGYFPETENKLLGIEPIGREGLEKIIRTAMEG
ncbi:hypothetical protein LY78DRAFT_373895 [Colletotrichum sublineola]|nr:hypothetical protein LY78DRAFT_373895 [Colletotrichum sublineola]